MTQAEKKELLKSRRQQLYDYIVSKNGEKVLIYQIIRDLPLYNEAGSSSHDPCPLICQDIHFINNSPDFEKIIVIDNFNYFIPTKKEADDYLEKLWDTIKARLYRFYRIKYKVDNNNQQKFDENATLKIIESLRNGINTDQRPQ